MWLTAEELWEKRSNRYEAIVAIARAARLINKYRREKEDRIRSRAKEIGHSVRFTYKPLPKALIVAMKLFHENRLTISYPEETHRQEVV